jgi:hypothetical protein
MARVSETVRRQMVAEAAYFRAERRGFSGGDPVADWLEAEAEVYTALQKKMPRTPSRARGSKVKAARSLSKMSSNV